MLNIIVQAAPRDALDISSSGSLDPSEMDSVPPAVSPRKADDAEVASRQMGQEEVVLEEPQGNPQDPRSTGDKTPQGSQSGVEPDTVPDSTVRVHGWQTPSKGVGHPSRRPLSNQRRRTICWRRSK